MNKFNSWIIIHEKIETKEKCIFLYISIVTDQLYFHNKMRQSWAELSAHTQVKRMCVFLCV